MKVSGTSKTMVKRGKNTYGGSYNYKKLIWPTYSLRQACILFCILSPLQDKDTIFAIL